MPAESETVESRGHELVPPLPSCPSVVMVTPASGVSSGSETTVRPSRVVVGATPASVAGADWVCGMPVTVAAAEIEIFVLVTGWATGAVRVRIAVCPAVMDVGLNDAVTPEGRPATLS